MKNQVTQEQIENLFYESVKDVQTVFDKCTVMVCKLKNGFIITETSACVDAKNYDLALGIRICQEKAINKLWELEGYKLQCELWGGEKD